MTSRNGLTRMLAIVAALAAASPVLLSTTHAAKPAPSTKKESPFACTPSALSPVERK